jgi:hypothetical protein
LRRRAGLESAPSLTDEGILSRPEGLPGVRAGLEGHLCFFME